MTTGREEVGMILANGRMIGLLVRKEKNIAAIGGPMYERLVKMVQEGASVDDILMLLPADIINEPCEFAKEICRDAIYRNGMAEVNAKRLGKPQNKSGETQSNDYTKTTGKLRNKLFGSQQSDNTNLTGWADSLTEDEREARIKAVIAYQNRQAFKIMQNIHAKDGVFLCYDKTIIAALHTPHGVFLGTNGIKKQPSQHICPRKGQSINQGYEKCVENCQQPSHAELAALLKYKASVIEPDFENSQMVVYGAKDICYHCKKTLELVGIQSAIVKPLNQLGELNEYQ